MSLSVLGMGMSEFQCVFNRDTIYLNPGFLNATTFSDQTVAMIWPLLTVQLSRAPARWRRT